MSSALIDVLIRVLAPLAIGGVCLFTRRDNVRAIIVLSVVALALGGFDFIVYFLELADVIPVVPPSPNYAFIDAIRIICNDVASYIGMAALAFALYRAAQTGRLGWMTILLIAAMVALVMEGIDADPLVFFSRLAYTRGDAIIFAAGRHLLPLVTLIYALATRPRIIPVIVPPAPSLYQPMGLPPPAPYGYPASYGPPPPPVVLPTPQPQPPTMTPPS